MRRLWQDGKGAGIASCYWQGEAVPLAELIFKEGAYVPLTTL